MPILDLQMRASEVGRIRLGKKVATSSGGSRPSAIGTFRFTSPDGKSIQQIADLYGGDVEDVVINDIRQWEVTTEANSIPVRIPGNSVNQWYEQWSKGGCTVRCDGVTDHKNDKPCHCNPEDRACKPTTRMNVILQDVSTVGLWRLETKGWNAASELPVMAGFINGLVGIECDLNLVEKKMTEDGRTSRFVVPQLRPKITITELAEIKQPRQQLEQSDVREIEAPDSEMDQPEAPEKDEPDTINYFQLVEETDAVDRLREIWEELDSKDMLGPKIKQKLTERSEILKAQNG